MNNKILKIIETTEDKQLFEKIGELFNKFETGATTIQIENFILNNIEFPTNYSKFIQSQLEISNRFNRIIDLYYNLRETEIKIKKKDKEIIEAKDELDKELAELQKEKLEIKLLNLKKQLSPILNEIKVFYKIYQENPDFHNLSPEKAFELEAENWTKKTLNMPDVFYQRYGKEYLYKALGKEMADEYIELQRKSLGLLPREILEVKKLDN